MVIMTLRATAVALLGILAIVPARAEQAQDSVSHLSEMAADGTLKAYEENMDMGDVIALFREQQKELAAQRKLLEKQAEQIDALTRELEAVRAPLPAVKEEMTAQRTLLNTQSEKISSLTRELETMQEPLPTANTTATGISVAAATSPEPATKPEPETPQTEKEQEIATGNAVAQAQADDPSRDLLTDFKGAWRLPGTDAALAIGGFVKTDIVYNFDPLQIKDRFITGSIPVGVSETTGDEAQSSITADQSRLNFDLRSQTDYGIMRAFIEGDFAGSNDTFRLRHAFGQWRQMLAGKTWSTFMDPDASPEEIDFEGLNARINVRQAQIRFMPTFGKKYELQFALEDPNPQVQNGSGVTRTPDVVIAGRFQPRDRLHVKLALLMREIRGQDDATGNVEKELAWGTSLSGRFMTPTLDERDSLLFQLNYGKAIGRYVNDLSSIGNYDGIFDPSTNKLQLFDVIAGYASWQHWWGLNQLRSNITFGFVDLNNPAFVEGDAYKRTYRFSTNLIWSPIPRIDLGGEYLWGRRENKDGEHGDASQFQFAVKYRF
jgi:outer membrane DcaP-like protein